MWGWLAFRVRGRHGPFVVFWKERLAAGGDEGALCVAGRLGGLSGDPLVGGVTRSPAPPVAVRGAGGPAAAAPQGLRGRRAPGRGRSAKAQASGPSVAEGCVEAHGSQYSVPREAEVPVPARGVSVTLLLRTTGGMEKTARPLSLVN